MKEIGRSTLGRAGKRRSRSWHLLGTAAVVVAFLVGWRDAS